MVRKEYNNPFAYVIKFPKTKFKQYARNRQNDRGETQWTVAENSSLWNIISDWVAKGENISAYSFYKCPGYSNNRYEVIRNSIMKMSAMFEYESLKCARTKLPVCIVSDLFNIPEYCQARSVYEVIHFFRPYSYNTPHVDTKYVPLEVTEFTTLEDLENWFSLTKSAKEKGFVSVDTRAL